MQLKPFKLEQYFARYEFNAPYQLCNSDCEAMSIGELLSLDAQAESEFRDHWLGYTEAQGDPALRSAIAGLYDGINAEQTLVLTGAQEGIFLFMNVALNAGDHIIAMYPAYQSLYQIADDIGCEVTRWELQDNDDNVWRVDLDFLRDAVQSNTKAIIINSPHNPTGFVLSEAERQAIIALAREHDLYIFSDEVYAFLEHDNTPRLPSLADVYEKAIALNVMSKSFGLAGLRIGWVASQDEALLAQMLDYKFYTTICNSAPSEFLSRVALTHKDILLERNRTIIRENIKTMQAFMTGYGDLIAWSAPKAGAITFPRLRLEQSVDDFCRELVESAGVLLLPSSVYDFGDRYFRLGLGRRNFATNLEHFGAYLDGYA